MKGKLLPFRRPFGTGKSDKATLPENAATRVEMAEVIAVEKGEARRLRLAYCGSEVDVDAHADSVPALSPGERVLAMSVRSEWLVMSRVREAGEAPSLSFRNVDGRAHLETPGLAIRAGELRLEMDGDRLTLGDDHGTHLVLSTDGTLELNGKRVSLKAVEGLRIGGRRIDLG